MVRVLQVVTDTDRRGAQVFAVDLEDSLTLSVGPVVTVALTDGSDGGLDAEVLGPSRTSPRTARELRRRARDADVVIAHGSTTLPMCAASLWGSAPPFVYRQIGDPRYWTRRFTTRHRVALLYRRAAHVVALWPDAAVEARDRFGIASSAISVIPNGVPQSKIQVTTAGRRRAARARFGIPPGAPTASFIGSLSHEKGPDLAVELAAQLPNLRLLMVGDGPLRDCLEAKAIARAPGRVYFFGSLSDPAPAYHAADVVVIPSRTEGMPAVAIEAAFAAVPCVAFDVGAIDAMLADGRGVVVPAGDLAALARAVGSVLSDRVGAASVARSARDHALQHWDMPVIARSWAQLLSRVAGVPQP